MKGVIILDLKDVELPFGSVRARDMVIVRNRELEVSSRLDRFDVVAPMRLPARDVPRMLTVDVPKLELPMLDRKISPRGRKISQKSLVNPKPRKNR